MATWTTKTKNKLKWKQNLTGTERSSYVLDIGDGYNLDVGDGYVLVIQPGVTATPWTEITKTGKHKWVEIPGADVGTIFLDIGDGYNLDIGDGYILSIGSGRSTDWTNVNKSTKSRF